MEFNNSPKCGQLEKARDSIEEHSLLLMRSEYLLMMLMGQIENDMDFQRLCRECDVAFSSGYYAVVTIHIEDYGTELITGNDIMTEEDYRRARFVISNVFDELTERYHASYCLTIGREVVYIVNEEDDYQSIKSSLISDAETLLSLLSREFGLSVIVSIGDACEGYRGIARSYQESRQILDFETIMGIESGAFTTEDLRGMQQDTELPPTSYFDSEQKLVTCIRHQDYVSAKEILHAMIERQLQFPNVPAWATTLQYYGLLNTIIQATTLLEQELGVDILETIDVDLPSSTGIRSAEKLQSDMDALFDRIIEIDRNAEHRDIPRWLTDAKAWIDVNYTEDINISTLGNLLGINAQYLSRQFREVFNVSILEYLHQQRISRAIELLQSGENVKNVAQWVGYASVVTMNRAFKKYTGITPGRFSNS